MIDLTATDLQNLSEDAVYARLVRMTSVVEGLGAGVETRSGFIHDFVIRLQSILGQAYADQISTVGRSLNPLLASDSDVLDSSVLDTAALNFGLSRSLAVRSTGSIRIEVSTNNTILIPAGATFISSSGQRYRTEQAFAGRTSAAEVRSSTDRQLIENSDGNYEFSVSAIAESPGLIGQLASGEVLTPVSLVIDSLVSVTVDAAFSGGQERESDALLLARMRQLLPARSLSTRASITSFLAQPTAIPSLLAASTIGFGDDELVRGKASGFAGTAMADVYVRTAQLPPSTRLSLTGTATSVVDGAEASWTIPIGRDAAPGFYRVLSVKSASLTNVSLAETQRGFDNSPITGELIPAISDAAQAAFSRFQTAVLLVKSASTGVTVGDEQTFDIDVQGLPHIARAQSLVGSRRFRFAGGDTLVKAAVPTFVSIAIELHARPGVSLPAVDGIKTAVASYINTAGFAGRLHRSRLASIVHGFLPSGVDVQSIEVVLETLATDGKVRRLRVNDHIETPSEPAVATTARTCVFFLNPASVSITAYTESVPEIA